MGCYWNGGSFGESEKSEKRITSFSVVNTREHMPCCVVIIGGRVPKKDDMFSIKAIVLKKTAPEEILGEKGELQRRN